MLRFARSIRSFVPRLVPPQGSRYELFNLSTMFLVIIFCNYILDSPRGTTQVALSFLLGNTPTFLIGCVLVACALTGVVCAYTNHLALGFSTLLGVNLFWCSVVFLGFLSDPAAPAFAVAVLYGFFARQALHLAWEARRR